MQYLLKMLLWLLPITVNALDEDVGPDDSCLYTFFFTLALLTFSAGFVCGGVALFASSGESLLGWISVGCFFLYYAFGLLLDWILWRECGDSLFPM